MGRPSLYKKEYAEQAHKLCLLGAIDKEIGDFFGVSEQTINSWKTRYPAFREALTVGKSQADAEVATRLFQRALGYSHPEEKIFCSAQGEVTRVETNKHYAPDTTAAIFWLKNRQPERWRDKQEVESSNTHRVVTDEPMSPDDWQRQYVD